MRTASSGEAIVASGSYATSINSSAAVAISSLVAATAATGSPMNRTLSGQRACSSWLTGRMPNGSARSRPVMTALTPSSASALDVSIRVIRACGSVLRRRRAYSIRGRRTSSAKRVLPVTLAVASTFRSGRPMTRRSSVRGSAVAAVTTSVILGPPMERFRIRLGILSAQPGSCQLNGFVNLEIAGAATEVAGQGVADLLPAWRGVRLQE